MINNFIRIGHSITMILLVFFGLRYVGNTFGLVAETVLASFIFAECARVILIASRGNA